MKGNALEKINLMKIYNSDINKKCVDDSEKIRKEIMIKLMNNGKFIGIIANSILYTSSIELYKIDEYDIATSSCYLHIRCRENNKLLYFFSEDVNTIDSEKEEIEYTSFSNAADIIISKFNY